MDYAFSWMDTRLAACASGALWWPAARLLCVSDLHLGRSERLARRGSSLLPPYDAADTLDRLAAEIERRRPTTVVCLGDSFDDAECEAALDPTVRTRLAAMMAGRDWIWIAGNHDPDAVALGGAHAAELALGPFRFRHLPAPAPESGEVAGHLHPKVRRSLAGHALSRPCFLLDNHRMILPAFGTYTGGLCADDPAIAALLDPDTARAILTGTPCLALPLAAPSRRRA